MMQGSIIRTPTETRESRFNSTLSPARGTTKRSTASRPKYSSGLRPGADVKEKHQVGKQQQIELGARVHAEGHATIPAFSKCFFSIFWPKKPPTRAQIKIASMLTTKLPLLMGANSVSM